MCEKNHKEDLMVVKPDLGLVNLSMCGGLRRGKVSPSSPAKRDESRSLVDEVSQGSERCREPSHLEKNPRMIPSISGAILRGFQEGETQ